MTSLNYVLSFCLTSSALYGHIVTFTPVSRAPTARWPVRVGCQPDLSRGWGGGGGLQWPLPCLRLVSDALLLLPFPFFFLLLRPCPPAALSLFPAALPLTLPLTLPPPPRLPISTRYPVTAAPWCCRRRKKEEEGMFSA